MQLTAVKDLLKQNFLSQQIESTYHDPVGGIFPKLIAVRDLLEQNL